MPKKYEIGDIIMEIRAKELVKNQRTGKTSEITVGIGTKKLCSRETVPSERVQTIFQHLKTTLESKKKKGGESDDFR